METKPSRPQPLLQKEQQIDLAFARCFSTPDGHVVMAELERMARTPTFLANDENADRARNVAIGHAYKADNLKTIRTRIERGRNPTNEVNKDE